MSQQEQELVNKFLSIKKPKHCIDAYIPVEHSLELLWEELESLKNESIRYTK